MPGCQPPTCPPGRPSGPQPPAGSTPTRRTPPPTPTARPPASPVAPRLRKLSFALPRPVELGQPLGALLHLSLAFFRHTVAISAIGSVQLFCMDVADGIIWVSHVSEAKLRKDKYFVQLGRHRILHCSLKVLLGGWSVLSSYPATSQPIAAFVEQSIAPEKIRDCLICGLR